MKVTMGYLQKLWDFFGEKKAWAVLWNRLTKKQIVTEPDLVEVRPFTEEGAPNLEYEKAEYELVYFTEKGVYPTVWPPRYNRKDLGL